MTIKAFNAVLLAQPSPPDAPKDLTDVDCIWIKGVQENWIRFGNAVSDRILDRKRRVLSFAPGCVFAFIRWQSNDYGTIHSSIIIVRTVRSGETYSTTPHIHPGGEILLHLKGWPKVSQVLQMIDAVEALDLDAADVAPDYWRHVQNRICVRETPRIYTIARHKAYLGRRALLS